MRAALVFFGIISIAGLLTLFSSQQSGMIPVYIGDSLGDQIPPTTYPSLNMTTARRTAYDQSIVLSVPGLFTGGEVSQMRDSKGDVVDVLYFSDSIFLYTINFDEGLISELEGKRLFQIEDRRINLLGYWYTITNASYNPSTNQVRLQFKGPNEIWFEDFLDSSFSHGVRVNNRTVPGRVRITATNQTPITITKIEYLADAAPGRAGQVAVGPGQRVSSYLRDPETLLIPGLDLVYSGTPHGASALSFEPVGRGYNLDFVNNGGAHYRIPFLFYDGSSINYGRMGSSFHATEGQTISKGDYFVITSNGGINGVSSIYQFGGIAGDRAQFTDLAGGQRTVLVANNSGWVSVRGIDYVFNVSGSGIVVDLSGDGAISSDTVPIIVRGGAQLSLGASESSVTVTYKEPAQLSRDRVSQSVGFVFSAQGSRITASAPSFSLYTGDDGVDVGYTNIGTQIRIDPTRGLARITIGGGGSAEARVVLTDQS